VELGFTEELDNPLLFAPGHFPSKVGGHPAWLDPALIPAVPTCGVCSEPLVFLSQIYAGLDRSSNGFHRSIYVFCCRNGTCYHSNTAIRVFRCQLAADNPYYGVEPIPEGDGSELGENKSFAKSYNGHCHICQVCGGKAPNKCSKCKVVSYCSKQHQKRDWEKHRAECGQDEGAASSPYHLTKFSLLYKEHDLVIEREVLPDKENTDCNIEEIEDKYEMTEEDTDSLAEQYGKDEDPTFTKFKLRISHEPSQVLRYKRHGAPIWPVSTNQLTTPPPCTKCNQPRSFEFQLLPTLLYVLGVGKETGEADWACIVVYTCSADCEVEGYVEECGWVQCYTPIKS